jgi:phosphoenolpyruvate carboxylase
MTQEDPLHAPLAADIALLTGALDDAVRELSGERGLELVRELRKDAIQLRKGQLAGGREHFAQTIAKLSLDDLGQVARAFTQWFHLVNAAEEHHRVRMLRRHDPSRPAEDSLAKAVQAMKESGQNAAQLRAQLERMRVMPVLTAHPTEARRRTLRDHVSEVKRIIDALERTQGGQMAQQLLDQLERVVIALYGTEESRATKPSPRDEIEAGLDVFQRTLLEATPLLYRELEKVLSRAFPEEDWLGLAPRDPSSWVIPSFLHWGSWIGGDRDGNPFVTAHVTRTVLERNRALILGRYGSDVDALGRALSLSARRAPTPQGLAELTESLEHDRERFPEVYARVRRFTVHEPWREKLWYMGARLRATRERSDEAYVDAAGYQRDLLLLERTLVASGYATLAKGALRDARRRADIFGFHLASLDIRQHSGVHERVVGELLQALSEEGALPGAPAPAYAALSESQRCELLQGLLSRADRLAPSSRSSLSAETQDLLATLDMVGRARREQGPRACERYIVSFTSTLSDLLEVLLLQRAADLTPGELRPVPLLEQLEDLERAAPLAQQMLDSPPVRAAIGDELEVMLGYSDSCKQVGYVTSQVALRAAQHALADVVEQDPDLKLTIFHGRGGAIGRGGGPSHRAILAQPARSLRGRLRVTEQGETINARYGRLEIAERDLEQVISAVLLSGLEESAPLDEADLSQRDAVFERAAKSALGAYRQLLEDPELLARYAAGATPIGEVAALPIGSRPAARRKGISLEDLRAIPWVFSWNQSRHGLPGWYGLGTALETLMAELSIDKVRELYRMSGFFRALINNAELALSRADIDVAAYYARLAEPEASVIFPLVRAEWERTVKGVLEVVDKHDILGNRPHLLATVNRRNPYVDVLSHTQIELRQRLGAASSEEERERILGALFTTINGIAAGLQTAG